MSELSEQADSIELSEQDESKEVVKHDTFQRVLRQKKTLEEKLSKFEKQMQEIQMKEELDKQESLKNQKKFEELALSLEKKLSEEIKEKETFKKNWLDSHKIQAVIDRLPAKPKRPEYYNFIDIDKIEVDVETGINQESVDLVANEFIANYGELLDRKASKDLPNDAPSSKGKLTYEKWATLPLAERKARLKDVIN